MADPTMRPLVEDYSCSAFELGERCPCPTNDPDIAGIGVIVTFIATTAITAILSLVVMGLLTSERSQHVVDRWAHRAVRFLVDLTARRSSVTSGNTNRLETKSKRVRRSPSKLQDSIAPWKRLAVRTIQKVLLGLSDQALFVGIAMLLVQFAALSSLRLTGINYSLLSDLAWLSSATQQMSMKVLLPILDGKDFSVGWDFILHDIKRADTLSIKDATKLIVEKNDNGNRQRRPLFAARISRVVGLALIFVLQLVSNSMGESHHWRSEIECPAICLVKKYPGAGLSTNYPSIILLVITYIPFIMNFVDIGVQCYIMFDIWRARTSRRILKMAITILERVLGKRRELKNVTVNIFWISMIIFFLICIVLCLVIDDAAFVVFWSFSTSEYIRMITFIVYYIEQVRFLLNRRQRANDKRRLVGCPVSNIQNEWSNGQIIPVILMATPLLSVIQTYSDEKIRLLLEDQEVDGPPVQELARVDHAQSSLAVTEGISSESIIDSITSPDVTIAESPVESSPSQSYASALETRPQSRGTDSSATISSMTRRSNTGQFFDQRKSLEEAKAKKDRN